MFIGHSIQKQQNTHSSQVHMEHSLSLITSWATNPTSVTFKNIEIISSIFSDHNAMQLKINNKKKTAKKHKQVEMKQHATKQPMDH